MPRDRQVYLCSSPLGPLAALVPLLCVNLARARWTARQQGIGYYRVVDLLGRRLETFLVVNRWELIPLWPLPPPPTARVAALMPKEG